MYRPLILVATLLLLGAVIAGPALARPEWCETKCQPSTPPNILCTCTTQGAPVTTCGQWEIDMCGLLAAPTQSSEAAETTALPDDAGAVVDADAGLEAEATAQGVREQATVDLTNSLDLNASVTNEQKPELWRNELQGANEICSCSGTCSPWGFCIWGTCTGSPSCCLSCYLEGCERFCGGPQQ